MLALELVDSVDRRKVGGKVFYTKVLQRLGMQVPRTFVISRDAPAIEASALHRWLVENVGAGPTWKVAVRSSSALEDSITSSQAGHYLSLLGGMDLAGIEDAIRRVQASGPDMAVMIQPLIGAKYAGVAFSCDPLTYERGVVSMNWTEGLADELVSGKQAGHFVQVRQETGEGNGPGAPLAAHLRDVVEAVRILEKELVTPVDVEWVVDQENRLWTVQVRPVVLPAAASIPLDSPENIARLPSVVRDHSKVRLRKAAIEAGVRMAPAHALVCRDAADFGADNTPAARDHTVAAMSVVLLHPLRVEARVIREFAPTQGGLAEVFTTGCRRYAIRRYPTVNAVAAAEHGVLLTGLKKSWVAVSISQEVWNAFATGIIREIDDGYILEIALGHFVPKGVVPTSTVVLSSEGTVVSASWREQSTVYHFLDGHVVTETPPKVQLRLDDRQLSQIVMQIKPLFRHYTRSALEFGLVEENGRSVPYVIDVAESDALSVELNPRLLASGILSVGRCTGRLEKLGDQPTQELDMHLHDRPQHLSAGEDQVVVVAQQASIDLLPYVGAPGVVGFVFNHGSILGHLAVVLREKGIPAIAMDDQRAFDALPLGQTVDLDASRVPDCSAALIHTL